MKIHAALISLRAPMCIAVPALAASLLAGCAYVKHVPPGQSLNEAYARKGELVQLPPSQQPIAAAAPTEPLPDNPVVPVQTEAVEDSFTLGNLCLQQGRYSEAISAYQKALDADPSFAEAWNNLAIAYQNSGQDDKAMEAFKKYKMVAMH
jgi:tetratricopeptide (TPR) repeat protein